MTEKYDGLANNPQSADTSSIAVHHQTNPEGRYGFNVSEICHVLFHSIALDFHNGYVVKIPEVRGTSLGSLPKSLRLPQFKRDLWARFGDARQTVLNSEEAR